MKSNCIVRRVIFMCIIASVILYVLSHYDNNRYSKENIDDYVLKMCDIGSIRGVSIAVIDGEQEYYMNYGKEDGKRIDEDTLFELGSTTKAFTAFGIEKLKKEGRIKGADLVRTYLPWFTPTYRGNAAEITIDELLCHTSGIPSWTISTIPAGDDSNKKLLTQTVQNIAHIRLNNRPGTCHEYATINYDILALVMEEITGEKYEDFISDHILMPLGMEHSFFRTNSNRAGRIVQGYKTGFLTAQAYNAPTYYGNTAAGYLVSSTSDLMKWMRMWSMNSQESTDIVKDVLNYDVSESENYYAGWNIYGDYIRHAGNNPNYSSQVIISRKRQLAVFALSNLSGSSATKIADGVYRILLGEEITIGLWVDENSLMDFFSVLSLLIMGHLILLLWKYSSKRACILRICLGGFCLAAILAFPYVMHYSYQVLAVWLPSSVMMAVGAALCVSVCNILRGLLFYGKRSSCHSSENKGEKYRI